jgi:predicted metal-dependent RNase
MVWDITAIHTAYPEFMRATIRNRIFHKDNNPFLAPMFKRVGSQKERAQIYEQEGACVIIATSGMSQNLGCQFNQGEGSILLTTPF